MADKYQIQYNVFSKTETGDKSPTGHTNYSIFKNDIHVGTYVFTVKSTSDLVFGRGVIKDESKRLGDQDFSSSKIPLTEVQYNVLRGFSKSAPSLSVAYNEFCSCGKFVNAVHDFLGLTGNPTGYFTTEQVAQMSYAVREMSLEAPQPGWQSFIQMCVKTFPADIPKCFLTGTPVLMADGTHKPIEQITPGDHVMAFDPAAEGGRGAHVPRPVTQTFTNETRQIVDLRGLRCTPGHVFLTGETDHLGRGVFKTIAAILKEDGTMVEQDGSVVRARTGAKLGSIEDTPVHVAYRDPETGAEPVVLVRAGVPAITVHRLPERGGWEHQSWSLAQWSARHGVDVLLDGNLRTADGTLYGASDWPKGPTPLDTRETQNWVVRTADGQPYTPPWIAELSEADEHASLSVGEGLQPLMVSRNPAG